MEKIIYVVLAISFLLAGIWFSRYQIFDSNIWQNKYQEYLDNYDNADGIYVYTKLKERRKMARYLVFKGELIGKNKEEIISILGLEENVMNNSEFSYNLGFRSIHEVLLKIYFNKENFVENAEIHEG